MLAIDTLAVTPMTPSAIEQATIAEDVSRRILRTMHLLNEGFDEKPIETHTAINDLEAV